MSRQYGDSVDTSQFQYKSPDDLDIELERDKMGGEASLSLIRSRGSNLPNDNERYIYAKRDAATVSTTITTTSLASSTTSTSDGQSPVMKMFEMVITYVSLLAAVAVMLLILPLFMW
jgi:hypothetical protein